MELIKYSKEVIAKFIDTDGTIKKFGLGTDSLTKTDDELRILAQQKYDEAKLREANPPPPSYQELRQKEYLAQGITEKEMIVALWEWQVEGRMESKDLLQSKRGAIKLKYPKG